MFRSARRPRFQMKSSGPASQRVRQITGMMIGSANSMGAARTRRKARIG